MGCNTTKESFKPPSEEKESEEKGNEKQGNEEKENVDYNADISKLTESGEEKKGKIKEEFNAEKQEAAAKIQALYRGYHQRKFKPLPRTLDDKDREDPSITPLSDPKELTKAAIKIQATFRGHMSRKEQAAAAAAKSAITMVGSSAAKIEEKMQDAVHELEGIDLADPDLHKAATKIQASFRGHKVRQEVCMHPTAESKK